MLGKISIQAILIAGLFVLQKSMVGTLPDPFNSLDLVLIVLVYLLALKDSDLACIWALSLGALFDFFSVGNFGLNMFSYLAVVALLYLLLSKYLTNRSLYSLLGLTLCAVIFHEALDIFFSGFLAWYRGEELAAISAQKIFYTGSRLVIVNLAVSALAFNFINFLSNRFRPVFLSKK